MKTLARRVSTLAAAALVAAPIAAATAPAANASTPAISSAAFGMHWLNSNHAFPGVSFGAGRIWDMGVTWADLQQYQGEPFDPSVNGALGHLDGIVNTFRARHVDPLITLGMTPAWAAATNCSHGSYSIETCPPAATGVTSPWGQYVTALANRYRGKVTYFELWNEPSLHSSYTGSPGTLAAMQGTAYSILHARGERLVTPSVAFTNGSPSNGSNWLLSFLRSSGGKSYDILGVHLYAADSAARGGYGPEWGMNTGLVYAKKAVAAAHAPNRPIWDTEYNVGRQQARTGYRDSSSGAGPVARSFILATQNHVDRTFWYAADDRNWGGTFLEKSDFRTLTTNGVAEKTVRSLLVGKAALGCSQPRGTAKGNYTCYFGTTSRHKTLIAVWTTGKRYTYHAPKGTKSYYTVTGSHHSAAKGKSFSITSTPVYISGSF